MNENSKRKQFGFGLKVGKKYLESQVSRNQTVNDWQSKRKNETGDISQKSL